ncbi:hypothetical protein [Pseudonocardia sp. McavD-2-B]|uniref:hypothetical protein n=1 Tax=Pseudonocardia sp. McavD-2-B TaxID=2954499 RepID=UPI0020980F11|nr:hypothetical protein [Pseudonocardia sp. McavD-2-B]MCO7192646.1 hypothetical protein [Pseudonocardia sp. McavD-2-B]
MGEPFRVSESGRAAGRIRELVRRIAVEVFGTTETEVPIPGFTVFTDRKLDDPLAGVRAALLMRSVAEAQLYDYARSARAAGRSWDEIGAVLGLSTGGVPVGEEAFDWLVCGRVPDPERKGIRSWRTPSAYWRCTSCDAQVTDDGPFESHPADNETGHTDSCTRHQADIAAWKQRTGWDD